MAAGTAEDPWVLTTAPGTSQYTMHRAPDADPPALVCTVGKTTLTYHLRAVDDLHQMLVDRGDWVELGAADEQKPARPGTVEAWARDESNPVGGWYGLRKGYRAASVCTCRRCWRSSAWSNWNTTRATTGSGHGSRLRCMAPDCVDSCGLSTEQVQVVWSASNRVVAPRF